MFRLRSPAARHLLVMVGLVVVLDAMAIVVYSFAGIATASQGVRTAFGAGWTLATLVVVGVGLRRVRRARWARLSEGRGER